MFHDPQETQTVDQLDIAIIAGVRFGIGEPHAGGLERHTDVLARRLAARGHAVTVFAGTAEGKDGTAPPPRPLSSGSGPAQRTRPSFHACSRSS